MLLLKQMLLKERKSFRNVDKGVLFCWGKRFHNDFFFVFMLGVSFFTVIIVWIA